MNNFIEDNNTYILAKDKNGNNVTNKQIQDIVFKIILEIDRLCRKHNIEYALAFGSALGLYKYGDFIPWDDDADIVIKYEDYARFVEVLNNELGSDFTFECYEVDKRANVLIPPIKIRYKNSYIKEKTRFTLPNRTKRGIGIFVDVATLMGVPEDLKEHKKVIRKSKLWMPIYVFLDAFLHINPLFIKRKLKKYEREIAEKYKDSKAISQSVILPFQDTPKSMVKDLSFKYDTIYPFKEYEMRGHKIYSFNNIEDFCISRYGESARKVFDGEKYIETYKPKKRKNDHIRRVDIF